MSGCLSACHDSDHDAADGGPPPGFFVETTRLTLPDLKLASPTAFAFASRSDGAFLVWAPPGKKREIRRLRLSRGGSVLGGYEQVVGADDASGLVTDLVATPVADRFAVAWVERLDSESRLEAVLKDAKEPATVIDLGPAWHTHKTVRGNVALAADRDRALVFARGRAEPCISRGDNECFAFGLYQLGSEVSQPRGLPLNVPVPCERYSTHLFVRKGGWFYGVCTQSDATRVTTLFDIQFNPEYASAERLLPGCQPLGIVTRASTPWLVGSCGEKRSAVKLDSQASKAVDLGASELGCAGRRLLLKIGDSSEDLGASRTDLAPLLPARLTRRLEQVVYTGASLLLARPEGDTLKIERYACVPHP